MIVFSVGCFWPLFGIFCLIFLDHSLLCSCEVKSKSARKSIQIHSKLIYRSPLNDGLLVASAARECSIFLAPAAVLREIDLLLERDGVLYPVDIKMSANPRLDMTDAFDVLDLVHGKKRGPGTVVCMYDRPLMLNERNRALPVEYL